RWYDRLSKLFGHELSGRQSLILYGSHPMFQQTNVLNGQISEGTGGVTESFKRRIIMPLAGPLKETDHVLGHELVHAFQYDMSGVKGPLSSSLRSGMFRLPLWFIEGMAEYLTVGPYDPHTAMSMRDAASRDKFPTIKQLASPRYCPYRYGQALWSYLAGRYGDQVVPEMLRTGGKSGNTDDSFKNVFKIKSDTLSGKWTDAIKSMASAVKEHTFPASHFGTLLIDGGNEGELNLSPSLSPDGRYLAFLSSRDLFSIELYLADVETGRVLHNLTSTVLDPHLQSLQFLYSSGSWHPDGRIFMFPGVGGGTPYLETVEVESGDRIRRFQIDELDEILSPSWSPDGRKVVFSGLHGGLKDLFIYDLDSEELKQMTDDPYADI
ncbi:hypothetical protein BVY01_01625, partial [bacterium I07]